MFFKCKTKEESKVLFRRLAKFLHPDKGGDSDLMILLTQSYEAFDNSIKNDKKEDKKQNEKQNEKQVDINLIFQDIIELDKLNSVSPSTREFVNSLYVFFQRNNRLTDKQFKTLCNIHSRLVFQNEKRKKEASEKAEEPAEFTEFKL